MPTQVQFRRGNESQNDAFTGAAGEIVYDTTNSNMRVHDGSTQGGSALTTAVSVAAMIALETGTNLDLTNQDTDDLSEGTTNKYYTDERVDDRVGSLLVAGSGISLSYNDAAGTMTITGNVGDITGVNAGSGLTGTATDGDATLNIGAGTGITVNADDIAVDMSAFDTDDVSEGSTNQYYTDARADARIANALVDEDNMASDSATQVPSQQSVKAYVDATVAGKDNTDEITEGSTNLYFTDERVDDRVGNLLVAGTGITMAYNDAAGTMTINGQVGDLTAITAGNGLTGGGASGAVDMNVVGGTGILVAADSVSVNMSDFSTTDLSEGTNRYYTDARAQAAITGGTGVTVTNGDVVIGQDVATSASPTFAGMTITGDMELQADIIPNLDNTHALGSLTKQWKDVFVGPGSLYVNGQRVVSDESGTITISADEDQNVSITTSGSGDVELNPTGTGVVALKGPVQVEAAANITSSDGNAITFANSIDVDAIESRSTDTDLTLTANGTGKVYVNDNFEASGNVVVGGNLTVSGTTTTVNSETISLADNIIDLNSNFTSGTPTEDAGIRVMRGDSTAVQMKWVEAQDAWQFTNDGSTYHSVADISGSQTITNKSISGSANTLSAIPNAALDNSSITVNGTAVSLGGSIAIDSDAVQEGSSSLYYTDARADGRIALQTGANLVLTNKSTGDLSEGSNLYHTEARVRGALSAGGDLSYNSSAGTFSFSQTYSTPTELLTALKTVDGASSGLDADLLDGQTGSYYTNASNIGSGTIANARLPDLVVGDMAAGAIQTSAEAFSDSDTVLMTAKAAEDRFRINIYNSTGTLLN